MNLGELFSKIETLMSEAYLNKTLDKQTINFKKMVLENKNLSKIYYLYSELNKQQGLDLETSEEFINEYSSQILSLKNKVELNSVSKWVSNIICENRFKDIDRLVDSSPLMIKEKISSKKFIRENLTKSVVIEESIKIPLSTMEKIKQNVVKDYLSNLDESTQKQLHNLFDTDDKKLKSEFKTIRENTIDKLNSLLKSETDSTIQKSINETIDKVSKEEFNIINYVNLKSLNEEI